MKVRRTITKWLLVSAWIALCVALLVWLLG
jgi:hypothetical protein